MAGFLSQERPKRTRVFIIITVLSWISWRIRTNLCRSKIRLLIFCNLILNFNIWWINLNLVQYYIHLTLYWIMLTFNVHLIEALWKHVGKRKKCSLPEFSPFSTLFSTLAKKDCTIWATLKLLSANGPFSLLFTKRKNFRLVQIEIICRWQNKKNLKNDFCLW